MDDDKKGRLERLKIKYYLYLQLRDPKQVKWTVENHQGIQTASFYLTNAIEKAIKEGNVEEAEEKFEEFTELDRVAYTLGRKHWGEI